MHVVERYFVEELSSTIGYQADYEFLKLRPTCTRFSTKRSLITGHLSTELQSAGGTRTLLEISPCSDFSSVSNTRRYLYGSNGQNSDKSVSAQTSPYNLHLDFLPRFGDELCSVGSGEDMPSKALALLKSGSSNVGLLFTDAAHSVLN